VSAASEDLEKPARSLAYLTGASSSPRHGLRLASVDSYAILVAMVPPIPMEPDLPHLEVRQVAVSWIICARTMKHVDNSTTAH